MDEDAQQLRDRVDDLEATVDEQQALIQRMMPSRRQVLTGAAAVGGFALGAGSATAADTSDGRHAAKFGQYAELEDPGGDTWADVPDTGDIDLKTRGLTNVGSINTEKATINQVVGSVYPSTDQTISNQTVTKIQFDSTIEEDTDVVTVDLSNNNISVNVDGLYILIGSLTWRADSGWSTGNKANGDIKVNGSRVSNGTEIKVDTIRQRASSMIITRLNASDTITLSGFQDSGAGKDIFGRQSRTRLSVTRLG